MLFVLMLQERKKQPGGLPASEPPSSRSSINHQHHHYIIINHQNFDCSTSTNRTHHVRTRALQWRRFRRKRTRFDALDIARGGESLFSYTLPSFSLASGSSIALTMEQYDLSDTSSELSSIPSTPLSDDCLCPPSLASQGFHSVAVPARTADMTESAPVRKRRKIEPKPRITRYLDLTEPDRQVRPEQEEQLQSLLRTLRGHRKIVVVAGAGISVSAGIPDFRSSHGLFSTLKKDHKLRASGKQLFDASVVYQDESMISSFHDMVRNLSDMSASAKPTAFHHLLARLAAEKRLLRLYTQNVDGIESSLPPLETSVPLEVKGPWPKTIQLHGGLNKMVCQKCNKTSDFQSELFRGPDPPLCGACEEIEEARTVGGQRSRGIGKLRPRMVLYNEHNPDEEAIGSVVSSDLRARPDALVVVGTSLKIPGVRRIVKEMCRVVRGRRNGTTIWINHDSLPSGKEFEDCWDLAIKGDCDNVAHHAGLKRWDDNSDEIFDECTSEEVERIKSEVDVSVVITPKKPTQQPLQFPDCMPTPSSSSEDSVNANKRSQSPTPCAPAVTKQKRPRTKIVKAARKPANNKPKAKKTKAGDVAANTIPINKAFPSRKATSNESRAGKGLHGKLDEVLNPIHPESARSNGPAAPETKESVVHT
ncbi:Sir2 family histone deacetylase Hst4 [Arthroderma uncinatum]|uniref:Sir2 family histone deacetylase Hst4 n=1 Tax=Arthroderma uncinatum TaxID=74035 RepID=UPI00144A53B9|nr:Sir2 family histone deacetylase Hst4 [Arthroderma uncinatum]KAF3483236.1 Sir2 family histone deacetylase Hst4 [Arthroderma uncinatum]